jgi:hypothetical protein
VSDVIDVVDGLDLVVELSDGVVHPEDVASARTAALRARNRRGYLGGTLVMAIAGGTGSGKSSLVNALAGEEVSSVSPTRPHTDRAVAWVPAGAEPALEDLLDRLGIEERVTHHRFTGLALLDLTDIDSVEEDHRAQVEALLPEVDGIIWVLDPEKYAEPVLHEEFIAPLADSADQFLFVLNQVDRLAAGDRVAVAEHLEGLLATDGIEDPVVFYLAADPPGEPPRGVDALAGYLAQRMDGKRVQLTGVLAETRRTARGLAAAAGLIGSGSLAFEERWADLIEDVSVTVAVEEPDRGAFEKALYELESFVGRLAAEARGPFALQMRNAFPQGTVETALRQAVDRMEAGVSRLPDGVIDPEERAEAAGLLAESLQESIGAPLRKILWARAALAASVAGLAVDVTEAEARLRA